MPLSVFAVSDGSGQLELYTDVYYSDLFYLYEDSYLKSDLLKSYVKDTYNINDKIYNEYCDSAEGFWTVIKTSLNAATSPKDYFKLMSSTSGGEDFTYEKALDKANTKLFTSLIGGYNGAVVNFGNTLASYEKRFSALAKCLNALKKDSEKLEGSKEIVFETVSDALLADGGVFYYLTDEKVKGTLTKVLDNWGQISLVVDGLCSYYDFMVNLCIGMIMEDVRLETVNYVIANVDSDTAVYDGFTRLNRQLTDGFEDYFINTYIVGGAIDLVYNGVFSAVLNYMDGVGSAYKLTSAVIKIASAIVFDVIFDVPDLDDMMLQYILSAYASDLYDMILDPYSGLYLTEFDGYFTTDSVRGFEDVFSMYVVATNEALKASEKLTLSSNEDELASVVSAYSSFNYDTYIDDIRQTLTDTDVNDRAFKRFADITLTSDVKFKHTPDDMVEDGYFYTRYGTLYANVIVDGSVNFADSETVVIDGTLEVSKGGYLNLCGSMRASSVSVYGVLDVNKDASFNCDGDLYCGVSTYSYVSQGTLTVGGDVYIAGDITLEKYSYQSTYYYGKLCMKEEGGALFIGGDFDSEAYECCDISDGKIVFNGGEQQTVNYLSCQNIEVDNPAGIRYGNSVYIYGSYDLHGNPIDNEGGSTIVGSSTLFTEGSDYGYVNIPRGISYTLDNSLKADISVLGSLIVPRGSVAAIDGNVSLAVTTYPSVYASTLTVDGILTVTGNLKLERFSYQSSYYYYAKLNMTKEDSVLYLGGDFSAGGTSCCNLTAGTVVFNGARQQTLTNLTAYNIEVLNPYGIKYATALYLKGNYDLNCNPVDNNGYNTVVYSTASFGDGSDYGNIYIEYGKILYLNSDIKANIRSYGTLCVSEGEKARVDGDVYIAVNGYDSGVLRINGELEITGDLTLARTSYQSYYYYGYMTMGSASAVLALGGNLVSYNTGNFKSCIGKAVFNGSSQQNISRMTAPTVVLKNESEEGVVFDYSLSCTTLFDHNNCVSNAYGSFTDYDGDGIKDNLDPDPKAGPDTVPVLSCDGYLVSVTAASELNHIRYAKGEYTTSNEIRNAPDCVNIDSALIAENTLYGSYVKEMPDGDIYSFWIRTNDGDTYIYTVDLSYMTPTVSADGVAVTVGNLYGVKDFYIAKGNYDNTDDVKANKVVQISSAKINSAHSYSYTVPDYGEYTVLVRYNDSSREHEILHIKLRVREPIFSQDGLQLTVGNLSGVRVVRVAYGSYTTPSQIKNADSCRNFTAKSSIKGSDSYTVQFRENGTVSVSVEYLNGYVKIYQCEIVKKTPTVNIDGNTVTFGDLDGLQVLRYAEGEYTTAAEIKNAKGMVAIKSAAITDGHITVTLDPGVYTFCVQYTDESYNYYTITAEG